MPRKGIVYHLFSDVDEEDYVGSTWDSKGQRLSNHQCHVNKLIRDGKHPPKALQHFNGIGWDNVKIAILEEREFEDIDDRLFCERDWIEAIDPSLNVMRRPRITEEERVASANERNALRRQDPKYQEYMREYSKKYRAKNATELKMKKKLWALENAEKIKEHYSTPEYKNKKNERRRNTTWHCDTCNVDIKGDKSAFARHCKCKAHLDNLPTFSKKI